jgi:dephospho-CoA kinase
MFLIGITGSMGCGKSSVARLLLERGAHLIDSDQLARAALAPGTPGRAAVLTHFGADLENEHGVLNRRLLGTRAFSTPEQRQILEEMLHPRVIEAQAQALRIVASRNPDAILCLDIPLLFETGAEQRLDQTICVACGTQQMARLDCRGGAMPVLVREGILARQWPEAEKCRRAHHIIDNTQDPATTRRQVQELWPTLVELARSATFPRHWPQAWRPYLNP